MKRTNIYIDPEKLQALRVLAATENQSVSDLVREAIDAMLTERLKTPMGTKDLAQRWDALMAKVAERLPAEVSEAEVERDVPQEVADRRAKRVPSGIATRR